MRRLSELRLRHAVEQIPNREELEVVSVLCAVGTLDFRVAAEHLESSRQQGEQGTSSLDAS